MSKTITVTCDYPGCTMEQIALEHLAGTLTIKSFRLDYSNGMEVGRHLWTRFYCIKHMEQIKADLCKFEGEKETS